MATPKLKFLGLFLDASGKPLSGAEVLFDGKPATKTVAPTRQAVDPVPVKTPVKHEVNFSFTNPSNERPTITVRTLDGQEYAFDPQRVKAAIQDARLKSKNKNVSEVLVHLGSLQANENNAVGAKKAGGPKRFFVKDDPALNDLDDDLEALKLGSVTLRIPPTAMHFVHENQVETTPILRGSGIQVRNGGQDRTIVVNLFFQADGEGRMPVEFVKLLAMAECAPFVPIENLHLNIVLDIAAVGILSYSLESVEGMPMAFNLQLVLKEFNFRTYLPYAASFADVFEWPIFEWHLSRYAEKRWGVRFGEDGTLAMFDDGELASIEDRSKFRMRYRTFADAQRMADDVESNERELRDVYRGFDKVFYSCAVEFGMRETDRESFERRLRERAMRTYGVENLNVAQLDSQSPIAKELVKALRGEQSYLAVVTGPLRGQLVFDSFFPHFNQAPWRDHLRQGGKSDIRSEAGKTLVEGAPLATMLKLVSQISDEQLLDIVRTGKTTLYLHDHQPQAKYKPLVIKGVNPRQLNPRREKDVNDRVAELINFSAGDRHTTEVLFDRLFITKLRVDHQAVMAMQTPSLAKATSMQYMGRMPKRISMEIRTDDLGEVQDFAEILGSLNTLLQAYQTAQGSKLQGAAGSDPTYNVPTVSLPEMLTVALSNYFLNSLGIRDVLIQRFGITTVPGAPNDFVITLEATTFDQAQRQAEEPIGPDGKQNVGGDIGGANSGEMNLFYLEQQLCRTETCPDLLLPTYADLNAFIQEYNERTGANLPEREPGALAYGIKYANDLLKPRFVDPDFYLKTGDQLEYRTGIELRDKGDSRNAKESPKAIKVSELGKRMFDELEANNIFPDWHVHQVKQSVINSLRYNLQERVTLSAAFPTFYLAFRTDEDTLFFWRNFGEFYGYRGLIAAELHESRDIVASTLKLTLSNVHNNLFRIDGIIHKSVFHELYAKHEAWSQLATEKKEKLFGIPFQGEIFKSLERFVEGAKDTPVGNKIRNGVSTPGELGTAAENPMRFLYLQPGARLHFRFGTGGTAAQLPPRFNGIITELMPGMQVEVLCQGDGIQLNRPLASVNEEVGAGFMWGDSPHHIIYNLLSEQYGTPLNPAVGGIVGEFMKLVNDQVKRYKSDVGVPVGSIAHLGNANPWFTHMNGTAEEGAQAMQMGTFGGAGLAAGAAGGTLYALSRNAAMAAKFAGGKTALIGAGVSLLATGAGALGGAKFANWWLKQDKAMKEGFLNFYDTESFKRSHPNATAFDNIYSVHGTGNWMEVLAAATTYYDETDAGIAEGKKPDLAGYIKIPLKGKTSWEVIKICEMTAPDYIASVVPYGTRSTLFFGLPWWDMTIANPKAEARAMTYPNCGYEMFRYDYNGMKRVDRLEGGVKSVPDVIDSKALAVAQKKGAEKLSQDLELRIANGGPLNPEVIQDLFKYVEKTEEDDMLFFGLILHRMHRERFAQGRAKGLAPFGLNQQLLQDFGYATRTVPNSTTDQLALLQGVINKMVSEGYSDPEMGMAFSLGRKLNATERKDENLYDYLINWSKHAEKVYRALGNVLSASANDKDNHLGKFFIRLAEGFGKTVSLDSITSAAFLAIDVATLASMFWTGGTSTGASLLVRLGLKKAVAETVTKQLVKSGTTRLTVKVASKETLNTMRVLRKEATGYGVKALAKSGGGRVTGKSLSRYVAELIKQKGSRASFLNVVKGGAFLALASQVVGPTIFTAGAMFADIWSDSERYKGDPIFKIKRPFRNVWMFDSYDHILDNQVYASMDQVYTDVTCSYDKGSTSVHADVNIFAHLRKNVEIQSPLVSVALSDNYIPTRWYAKSFLKDSMTRMYQGNFTVVGQPYIKPYDLVLMQDHYKDMNGPVQVRSVTHVLGPQTGLSAVIEPDLVVYTSGNNMELIHTWLWGAQAATMTYLYGIGAMSAYLWTKKKAHMVSKIGTQGAMERLSSRLNASTARVTNGFGQMRKATNLGKFGTWLVDLLQIKDAKLRGQLVDMATNSKALGKISFKSMGKGFHAAWNLRNAAPVNYITQLFLWNGIFGGLKEMEELAETQAVRMAPLLLGGQPFQAGMTGSIGLFLNVPEDLERKKNMHPLSFGYRNLDMVMNASLAWLDRHAIDRFVPDGIEDWLKKQSIEAAASYEAEQGLPPKPKGAVSKPYVPTEEEKKEAGLKKTDGVEEFLMAHQTALQKARGNNKAAAFAKPDYASTSLMDSIEFRRTKGDPLFIGRAAEVKLKGQTIIGLPLSSANIEEVGEHFDGKSNRKKYYVKLRAAIGNGVMYVFGLDQLHGSTLAVFKNDPKSAKTLRAGAVLGSANDKVYVSLRSERNEGSRINVSYADPRRLLSDRENPS